MALIEAVKQASLVLLEPVMAVEIDVPLELANEIPNEICKHRGRVERDEAFDGWTEFRAIVPLSELLLSNSPLTKFPADFGRWPSHWPQSRPSCSQDCAPFIAASSR